MEGANGIATIELPAAYVDLPYVDETRLALARDRLSCVVAAALIAWLNFFDVVTTHAAAARGGVEANPIARWLLDQGVLEGVKGALIGGIALLAARSRRPARVARSLWLVVAIYGAVVVNNGTHLV